MLITRSRLCDQAYKSRRIAQCRYSQMLILKQDKSCKCSEVCSTSDVSLPIGQHLSIRVLDGPSECLQVAKLRADAFYEVKIIKIVKVKRTVITESAQGPIMHGPLLPMGSTVLDLYAHIELIKHRMIVQGLLNH